MSFDPIEAKRKVIAAAEKKIDYFKEQITKRPKLARLWEYWISWYTVRRDDWITRAYLEQVRGYKQVMHVWERTGTTDQHMRELEQITRSVLVIEQGLEIIEPELKQILEVAREREWRIRYPKPQTTMAGWISAIHGRYPIIKEWIRRIFEELPAVWIDFVYVIYYSYTSVESERHLEAHLESKCHSKDKVKEKVKEMSNKILRAFVEVPRVVGGEIKPGYAVPLLRKEMANPPYQGRIKQGGNLWQWGIEFNAVINYMTGDQRVIPSEHEGKLEVLEEVPMTLEIFDFDYLSLRSYKRGDVPANWWTLPLTEMLRILNIEVPR